MAAIGVNYTSWNEGCADKDESTPPGAFRVIARSGDLPSDLLMVGTHVDPAVGESIRRRMVEDKA